MKDITSTDVKQIPGIVLQIYVNSMCNIPISISTYNEAIEKYPEYFPDEVEHKKKYDAIPKHIHDQYLQEMSELFENYFHHLPNKGMLCRINNQEEDTDWKKKFDEENGKYSEAEKIIHDKYYGSYDIDFNPIS